jgi:uncharacterized protein (DUF58 family)
MALRLRLPGRRAGHATPVQEPGSSEDTPLIEPEDLQALERLTLDSLEAVLTGIGGQREGPGRSVGYEFADYRRYTPGDDARRIDWNVYARLRELYVRTAPQEARLSLSLLLDASASMDFGEPNKLRFGRRLAALLGVVALLHSDNVQAHTLYDGDAFTGGRQDASGMLGVLVDQLERLPAGRTTRLASSVRRAREQGAEADLAVLISDALVPPEELALALRELTRGAQAAALVHVIDAAEETAGPPGSVRLLDRETGQRIEVVVNEQVRERYAERHAAFRADIERACRQSGVHYVPAPTSVDPLDLLLESARSELLLSAPGR